MSFIPYPKHIKPARVTKQLVRSDETFISPVTGIQQQASRGNAFWRWTIEYTDICESERNIVQSFLMACRGSLNSFKVPDFGNYTLTGIASAWTDVFSNRGQFRGSLPTGTLLSLEYYFNYLNGYGARLTRKTSGESGLTVSGSTVTSGYPHIQRLKYVGQNPSHLYLRAGSGSNLGVSPYTNSDGPVALPFIPTASTITNLAFAVSSTDGDRGDYYDYYDWHVSRCLLVSNSENLLLNSNWFSSWSVPVQSNVDSGGQVSPNGITDGAWKFYGTSANSQFYITQNVTKNTSEDVFALAVFALKAELEDFRLQ